MTVIIQQVTSKAKVKTISARLIQDGLAHVTALVQNNDGTQSMKRFSKEKYSFQFVS